MFKVGYRVQHKYFQTCGSVIAIAGFDSFKVQWDIDKRFSYIPYHKSKLVLLTEPNDILKELIK